MGRPQHFGRDLPTRCSYLIEQLWPTVSRGKGTRKFGGPLTTTFVLAMAMPMLLMPIERVRQPALRKRPLADDRDADKKLASRMNEGLDAAVGNMPFFAAGEWALFDTEAIFNTAEELPEEIAQALDDPGSFLRASETPASDLLSAMRNSLAHAGVMYLGADGRSSRDEDPVRMVAFVSELRGQGPPTARIIRVGELALRDFLISWAEWLREAGVAELIEMAVATGKIQ